MSRLSWIVAALLLGITAVGATTPYPPGTDPEGEEIDQDAFQDRWEISGERVAMMAGRADEIRGGGQAVDSDNGMLLPVSLPRCEKGPVRDVFQRPGVWYWPLPIFTRCTDLYCPRDKTCVAGKTRLRKFWTICYKQFNCWGVYIWIPIGIRRLCLTDERECECKARCRPFLCFPPRKFNPKTCDCECPPKSCRPPYELDPSSCQCRCPKDIICPKPKILDQDTCKCVCPKCPPGYKPDPKQNCKCVPVCDRRCPRGSYLDRTKCKCVGSCPDFYSEYDCNAVDSCKEYRDQKCRWFPTYPQNRCQCECCQPKHGYNQDCGAYSPRGKFVCNYWWDHSTNSRPCKWVCG